MAIKVTKSYLKKLIKEELGQLMYPTTFSLIGGAKSKIWEQGLSTDELSEIEKKLPTMKISEIGYLIKDDWKNIYFGAKPYLSAMYTMDSIKDEYGSDSGFSIIAYFLGNAQTYKGPIARMTKKELNRRLKKGSE